jgi:hypothetical protein
MFGLRGSEAVRRFASGECRHSTPERVAARKPRVCRKQLSLHPIDREFRGSVGKPVFTSVNGARAGGGERWHCWMKRGWQQRRRGERSTGCIMWERS